MSQQLPGGSTVGRRPGSAETKKPLHQDLLAAIRGLQTAIMKEDGNEREVAEQYKSIYRLLDDAVEKTRKRPEPRIDAEWIEKKQKLEQSRAKIMEVFGPRKKPT